MKHWLCRVVVAVLSLVAATESRSASDDPEKSPQTLYGPSRSPISWREVEDLGPSKSAQFSPPRDLLGTSQKPVSVRRVELKDERPYGEAEHRAVWLVRYQAVEVQRLDALSSGSVTLSLAFDVATNELVCAFTEAVESWPQSTLPAVDIASRVSDERTITPAHYDDLQSTLPEVLSATWKSSGADPSQSGQIIIRPRFVASRLPAREVNGQLVPVYPPCNVWIVEVLGTVVLKHHGAFFTTFVGMFRDGDLEAMPSVTLP
jgi:hypothetical protein